MTTKSTGVQKLTFLILLLIGSFTSTSIHAGELDKKQPQRRVSSQKKSMTDNRLFQKVRLGLWAYGPFKGPTESNLDIAYGGPSPSSKE